MSIFVKPDTKRLSLPSGLTIVVRARLNQGEYRQARARMFTAAADGTLAFNRLELGRQTVLAYLLDWTLPEDTVPIRGLDVDALAAVLDNLDPMIFGEIEDAILAHDAAILKARTEKKTTSGAPPSAATSSSPAPTDSPSVMSMS